MEILADEVDDAYREDYEPKDFGDTPSFIISEMLEAEQEIADDIANILSEREERDVHKGAELENSS